MYPIIEVRREAAEEIESVGSKEKFWFTRNDIEDNVRWLYKAARKIDEHEWTGEDWAEKVCEQLAALLGLPHAKYELATWDSTPGVVSRKIDRQELVLGNVVLAGYATEYPEVAHERYYSIPQYTLSLVLDVLQSDELHIITHPEWHLPERVSTAADVFAGYLLLDAWVGNTDRHDRNWAILESRHGDTMNRVLAPTFDHASSLGRELRDQERRERVDTNDSRYAVEAYAEKARSALFDTEDDTRPMLTVDAFLRFAEYVPAAAEEWLRRLRAVEVENVQEVLQQIPSVRVSDKAREFVLRLLHHNRDRLLED